MRRAKIILIPKVGKREHEVAKDFKPISLTSFSLRTMHRIVDLEVKENLQYAYPVISTHTLEEDLLTLLFMQWSALWKTQSTINNLPLFWILKVLSIMSALNL